MGEKYLGIVAGNQITAIDMENALDTRQANLPIGTILMYDGTNWQNNVTLVGCYRCDGSDTPYGQTPNLTDRFIRGSATRGVSDGQDSRSVTLAAANLPSHGHTVTDSGHNHPQNAHAHGYNDATGSISPYATDYTANNESVLHPAGGVFNWGGSINTGGVRTAAGRGNRIINFSLAAGGFGIHGATADISAARTGISIGNTGSGTAFTVTTIPAYYTVIYIKRMA